MNPSPVPFHCPEIDQLAARIRAADESANKAARWAELRTSARAALTAAESAFLASLDAPGAAAVADADATFRKVQLAAAAVENAGGPEAFRERVLYTSETFALLASGFETKLVEFAALKKGAASLIANATADALRTGEVTVSSIISNVGLDGCPAIRDARQLVERVEKEFLTLTYAHANAAGRAKGQAVTHRPFAELYGILTAPLPVLPTNTEAKPENVSTRSGW